MTNFIIAFLFSALAMAGFVFAYLKRKKGSMILWGIVVGLLTLQLVLMVTLTPWVRAPITVLMQQNFFGAVLIGFLVGNWIGRWRYKHGGLKTPIPDRI